jgi:hypothetical protein
MGVAADHDEAADGAAVVEEVEDHPAPGRPPPHQSRADQQVLGRERAALFVEVKQVAGIEWHVAVAGVGDRERTGLAASLDRHAASVQKLVNVLGGDLVGVLPARGGLRDGVEQTDQPGLLVDGEGEVPPGASGQAGGNTGGQ